MTNPTTNAARQREHWDQILSVDNIGTEALTVEELRRELKYARTPDTEPLWEVAGRVEKPLVIDLGGGSGTYAVALVESTNARVVVADVSGGRLRALRGVLVKLGLLDRVMLVQTSAENLAIRTGSVDCVWTRAVLIHTQLEIAVGEIARCLGPEGEAVLCEPTDANPFVRLYRRLFAPKEWEGITRYFDEPSVKTVCEGLSESRISRFYGISFLAFGWQFAVRSVALFRITLAVLNPLDRLLIALWPGWCRRQWFVVMRGKGRAQ